MRRTLLSLAWALGSLAVATVAFAAADDATPCRVQYVGPYTEQCEFAHAGLAKGASPKTLSQAFDACARAQDVALPCVRATDKPTHALSLSALYRAVSLQADIAMFARQFDVAEALLHEKLDVIAAASREARPGDPAPAKERTATERDLAEARAGQCTQHALASAGEQYALGKAHRYADLAALLKKKYDDYGSCAAIATVSADRAYVRYVALVALEESGRAAQAAGRYDAAQRTYRTCIDGVRDDARDATARVKGYLATVARLCKGRLDGTYRVDQPRPIDADNGKAFQPLTLPNSSPTP